MTTRLFSGWKSLIGKKQQYHKGHTSWCEALNWLVQGGQLYWAFPYARVPCTRKVLLKEMAQYDDHLVLTSLDQLLFIENVIYLFYKISYIKEEVNCTESPLVSIPCLYSPVVSEFEGTLWSWRQMGSGLRSRAKSGCSSELAERKKNIMLTQWKGSNCKQSASWQHVSQLKASAFWGEGKTTSLLSAHFRTYITVNSFVT